MNESARNLVVGDQSVLTNAKYLGVSYSEAKVPRGSYPLRLCELIKTKYFKRTGELLELGCGRGDHMKAFAQIGFKVKGVDISPLSPELAEGCEVQVADLERETLPYPNGSFDFVFSKSVIEHMKHPSCLMSKAYEALRPGGIAVIMTPSWAHTYWGPFYIDHTHVTPFTIPSLKEALMIAGFKDVEADYFYQLPFLWKYSFLKIFIQFLAKLPIAYRPYVDSSKWPDNINKLVRFSKEVMLIAVAKKA